MTNKPLVSYVVTAYNIEKYIAEAVQCAFEQTYSPLEIVLSDDCSTDGTFKIMKEMAEKYRGPHTIVLNRNDKNLGITRHMNKVFLELSTGEIIVVAHGDDVSQPERTSVMVEYLNEHKDCTQVACSASAVNESMQPLSDYVQKNFHVNEERVYRFGSGAHISIGFSAFRKQVNEFFGPLSDNCPTEDDAIGFRAIMLGNIAFIPQKLIYYRKHSGSNSNPDQFHRFPVDEIFKQNIRDMEMAVNAGLISKDIAKKESERLYKSKELRKVYRVYFANRSLSSLISLVLYKDISMRMRIHYIREHFEYLIGHHE